MEGGGKKGDREDSLGNDDLLECCFFFSFLPLFFFSFLPFFVLRSDEEEKESEREGEKGKVRLFKG